MNYDRAFIEAVDKALADVATWYREHRVGEYPLDRIDLL